VRGVYHGFFRLLRAPWTRPRSGDRKGTWPGSKEPGERPREANESREKGLLAGEVEVSREKPKKLSSLFFSFFEFFELFSAGRNSRTTTELRTMGALVLG
jgi:hypothetical protein